MIISRRATTHSKVVVRILLNYVSKENTEDNDSDIKNKEMYNNYYSF